MRHPEKVMYRNIYLSSKHQIVKKNCSYAPTVNDLFSLFDEIDNLS